MGAAWEMMTSWPSLPSKEEGKFPEVARLGVRSENPGKAGMASTSNAL